MTDTFRPFLMGAETEFAASGLRGGAVMDPDDVYELLLAALKHERAWAEDHHGYRGVFLQHGGRMYLDYGSHPEHATPECFTPEQVAAYDKAGEVLLDVARRRVNAEQADARVRVVKNNLDPCEPDHVSYGTHESYTCWAPAAAAGPQLIPHLVTRAAYAGAGALTGEGMGFELSARARHLCEVEGDDTTCNRAIFSTRIRKVADGGDEWVRIHLIGKDSQRAPFGVYLTYAATGLLVEMINRGRTVGAGLALADPVAALRQVSLDPWGKVKLPLADGRAMTALEVQSAYLEECARAVQAGGMPAWAGDAVRHWGDVLAALERDPLALADRLDAFCKLLIVQHELRRARREWRELRAALAALHRLRAGHGEAVVRAVLSEDDTGLSPEHLAELPAARQAAGADLDALRFATRVQALELNYHELGGLYDGLRQAGRMNDVVLADGAIEQASRVPPPGGRAALRGECVRAHRDEGWRADWQYVWHMPSGRCLDLRDPFSGARREVVLTPPEGERPWHVDVLGLLGGSA